MPQTDALGQSLRCLRGVGEARAEQLARLGLQTVEDLLAFYPRSYSDRTVIRPIAGTALFEECLVAGIVLTPPRVSRIRKGLELLKFRVGDGSGTLDVTYFNQSFLKSRFAEGTQVVLYGRVEGDLVRRAMANPECEFVDEAHYHGRFVPVYRLTSGLSQNRLRALAAEAVSRYAPLVEDPLPERLRAAHSLIPKSEAVRAIHLPESAAELEEARRRLVFEELLCLQLGLFSLKSRTREEVGISFDRNVDMQNFYDRLPFALTEGQRAAVEDAIADMRKPVPMNRLVQGDVGCGKTVVAAALIYYCVKNGCQAAMMAPTELLAAQHFESLAPLLEQCGIRSGILIGSLSAAKKRSICEQLASGEIGFAVGTQALIQEGVAFERLGLVIADEQHRFGVAQRAKLSAKGENPHLLVMSATPIPRTLALMMYGDLDVSVIRTMPAGRQRIDTTVIPERRREKLYRFLRGQIGEGRQVYVVCPLIEEGESAEGGCGLHSAETVHEELSERIFPDLRVALAHGRMKPADKDAVMRDFAAGRYDILVSTTVIEVGINVPNATVMVIENAERFGLAQLHQLRGRVGRGSHRSYCVLVTEATGGKTAERLSMMVKTTDGFEIAEADLAQRGPGDFFGSAQHGLPRLRIADMAADSAVVAEVQAEARELLVRDPELAGAPALAQAVQRLFSFDEGNFLN